MSRPIRTNADLFALFAKRGLRVIPKVDGEIGELIEHVRESALESLEGEREEAAPTDERTSAERMADKLRRNPTTIETDGEEV